MKHLKPGWIQILLDGEANEDERLWAERHVRGCATCRDRLEGAARVLKAVRQNLENLDPVTIPLPAPFDPHLRVKQIARKPFIRVFILAPIRVPAFLLVLMGGLLILLTCLYSVEKFHPKNIASSKNVGDGQGMLTITSPGVQSKIALNTPAYGFRPINNPLIFVLQKENNHE
jgi:hypothetical protein